MRLSIFYEHSCTSNFWIKLVYNIFKLMFYWSVISYMNGALLWANNYLRPHRVRYFSIRIHSSGMMFKQMFFITFLKYYVYWKCTVINKSFHHQQNMTCFNYQVIFCLLCHCYCYLWVGSALTGSWLLHPCYNKRYTRRA